MYNAFWRHALFVRGQSFSVKTYDRSRNRCQVIEEGAGDDFRGPSVQALPLPSRVSFSRAGFFVCPLLPSACYAGYICQDWSLEVMWTSHPVPSFHLPSFLMSFKCPQIFIKRPSLTVCTTWPGTFLWIFLNLPTAGPTSVRVNGLKATRTLKLLLSLV